MALEGLTPEGANRIIDNIRRQFARRNMPLSVAIANALEIPLPPDTDIEAIDEAIFLTGFNLIADSYNEPPES